MRWVPIPFATTELTYSWRAQMKAQVGFAFSGWRVQTPARPPGSHCRIAWNRSKTTKSCKKWKCQSLNQNIQVSKYCLRLPRFYLLPLFIKLINGFHSRFRLVVVLFLDLVLRREILLLIMWLIIAFHDCCWRKREREEEGNKSGWLENNLYHQIPTCQVHFPIKRNQADRCLC